MATATKPVPANLIRTKVERAQLISPLQAEVNSLTIADAEELGDADELLGNIRLARRKWADKMEPILKPLREAKAAADSLNREIDRPLEALEQQVKVKIGDYRREEARQLEAAREAQEREQAKIQRQLEETAAKELTARTKQMRERLAAKREELESKAEETVAETAAPTRVAHSTTRMVKHWRVKNMELLLRMIADGAGPSHVLMLDNAAINRQMVQDPSVVAGWPGFEVYEELTVVGRR